MRMQDVAPLELNGRYVYSTGTFKVLEQQQSRLTVWNNVWKRTQRHVGIQNLWPAKATSFVNVLPFRCTIRMQIIWRDTLYTKDVVNTQ